MNLDFEVVGFLPFYPRKLAKHNKRLVGRQMIKLLSRPTNNVELFCGKRKVANSSTDTSQNFALVCIDFGLHGFNFSSFAIFFQFGKVNFILTKH